MRRGLLLRTVSLLTAAVLLLFAAPPAFPAAAEAVIPDVPQVIITTDDGVGAELVKDDGYVTAKIMIYGTDGSIITDSGKIKVRGNSTAKGKKKPYTVKFDSKHDVEGMGAAKKWVLLADFYDPTLLRNYTVFTLAEQLGMPYTPAHCFAEVTLDGKKLGCYEICTPVDVHKYRVDLDLAAGDFLVMFEKKREKEGVSYILANGRKAYRFAVEAPEEPTEEQLAHIQEVMNTAVTAMAKKDYAALQELIDIPSFAKLYVINEYVKDVDFCFSSVYYYYKGGRLYAGPVWDFDLSCGNENCEVQHRYEYFMYPTGIVQSNMQLYHYLSAIPEFAAEVRKAYCENWRLFYELGADGGVIETGYEANAAVFARNFKLWRVSKLQSNLMRRPDATYALNLEFFRQWCAAREAWLSDYYGASEYGRPLTGDVDANGAVEMADAVLLAQINAEQTDMLPEDPLIRADLNFDRVLSAADLGALLRILFPPQDIPDVPANPDNPDDPDNPGDPADTGDTGDSDTSGNSGDSSDSDAPDILGGSDGPGTGGTDVHAS